MQVNVKFYLYRIYFLINKISFDNICILCYDEASITNRGAICVTVAKTNLI